MNNEIELTDALDNEALYKQMAKLKARNRHLEHGLDQPCDQYRANQFTSLKGKLGYRSERIEMLEDKLLQAMELVGEAESRNPEMPCPYSTFICKSRENAELLTELREKYKQK